MGTNESAPEDRIKVVLEGLPEDDQFAFDRVAEMVIGAAEIRRQAWTEGMPAEFFRESRQCAV